ncbi:Lactobacillus shifted protein [Salinomyces thailandicus]|uniref:Lactobacillus shifted protein n=1 Tax=Salinomyces thailandicus TaxID=706561 RepID=A0A4U0U3K4_9PEZI|nr:Lactobacillus shifted protein [Salinomyces thailandica]
MLQQTTRRLLPALTRRSAVVSRSYSTSHSTDNPVPANNPNPKPPQTSVSSTNATPTSSEGAQDKFLQESVEDGERRRVMQAPNREVVWSRSQKPRAEAMVGPRFEQTIMEDQPRPLAAIDLIHKQPVRWTNKRSVSCDGGGGPLGHPRIFINVDKPQICWCTYCGVPYAHEHHRKHLESLPTTTYPLGPIDDPAALPSSELSGKTGSTEPQQSKTGAPLEQR